MPEDNICADWIRKPLEQCVESIIDYRGKTPIKTTSGVPLITAKVIKKGRIDWDNVNEFISEDDYEAWMKRGIPVPGAVVITTEAPLGEVAQLGTDKIALAQRVITLCGKSGMLNNIFLRYLLQTNYVQGQLVARGSGTTVTGIKQSELRKVLLPIPPLPEQRAIADVLSALDDKIELNRQMNKTLEEMAQAIFKEWFVDFGPFRDGGMHDSELGPIPVGWRVGRFSDIAEILSGGTPKTTTAEYWNGPIPFFSPKDATNSFYVLDTEKHITEEGLRKCNSKLYPKDTVFISARGTVGKVAIAGCDMAMNQSCYALKGKSSIDQQFLFLQTLRAVEELKKNASGAVFDAIVVSTFDAINVVLPPISIIQEFCKIVTPMLSMMHNTENETESLSAIRDTLLPKLVSGELRVPFSDNIG